MNLEYLANLAEVFGMIMVVISLIYLNIQARHDYHAKLGFSDPGWADAPKCSE
jgi:hypothetical protein